MTTNSGNDPLAHWRTFKITTFAYYTPHVHELRAPSGAIIVLLASDFLSLPKFNAKYLDAMGELPPLPAKGRPAFLERIVATLFEKRTVIDLEARKKIIFDLTARLLTTWPTNPELESGPMRKEGYRLVCAGELRDRIEKKLRMRWGRRILYTMTGPYMDTDEFMRLVESILVHWGAHRVRAPSRRDDLWEVPTKQLDAVAAWYASHDAAHTVAAKPNLHVVR